VISYCGAHERYGESLSDEVMARLENELGVVADMGFSDYFLVVWDLIRHARERASASDRAAALGGVLHRVLPAHRGPRPTALRTDLRAILESRTSLHADIDMDFDERFRGDMIRYAAERYGSDHVAQIVTFSTIKARAAVRDGRARARVSAAAR